MYTCASINLKTSVMFCPSSPCSEAPLLHVNRRLVAFVVTGTAASTLSAKFPATPTFTLPPTCTSAVRCSELLMHGTSIVLKIPLPPMPRKRSGPSRARPSDVFLGPLCGPCKETTIKVGLKIRPIHRYRQTAACTYVSTHKVYSDLISDRYRMRRSEDDMAVEPPGPSSRNKLRRSSRRARHVRTPPYD